FEFHQGDIVGAGLKYSDAEFDYSMANGVFEILEDKPCESFIKEMCRTTKSGVFVEDLFEQFPGGYPRDHLHEMFAKHGFRLGMRHVILSEPFDIDRVRDPKKLWPVIKVQNLWLEKK
ncbi:MAG: class I SAM-dependent methyltransferase, partial [Bdellovibrionales bacterium]|nr:class I SAM-dependent methyltransferase [Bdellovibrionales bacterium]